jgi:hypothetical protein
MKLSLYWVRFAPGGCASLLWSWSMNFRRAWIQFCVVALVCCGLCDSATAAAPPSLQLSVGTPVSIEELDAILRARMPVTPQPEAQAVSGATAALSSSGCATGSFPIEILTLAASLKCDPDLIFEYVYNNIEYEPLFGSNKGAFGTLLDQRGDDIDQAQLLVALLQASGYSQISYIYGYIRLTGATAPGWLGVKNDGNAIGQVFENGGIPIASGQWIVNGDGTLNRIDIAHVWIQVQINGTAYVFDPSFKQHTMPPGPGVSLTGILGYSRTQFQTDAGGTIDSVSISGVNRTALRNDLVNYSNNLISYIKNNHPDWAVSNVVTGKGSINPLTGSPLRQPTLPNISPMQPTGYPQNLGSSIPNNKRTCFTISMPGVTPTTCASPSAQTIQLYADQTYGHRITVFSTGSACPSGGSCTPTLLIDGALPPNGQNTGTTIAFGQPWSVNVSIMHPYASTVDNQSATLTINAGGSYLIGAGWGQVSRGMIEKHRTLLAQANAAGDATTALGEALAVMSYTWLAEAASVQQLGDPIAGVTTQYHHGVGIAGQALIQPPSDQGPYVDLPMNVVSITPQTYASGFSPALLGAFYTYSGVASSLESAVLEQTQSLVPGMQAASTIRLIDNNANTGAKTFFADGTTAAGQANYVSTIRPLIVPPAVGGSGNYSINDYQAIDIAITGASPPPSTPTPTQTQVLAPINGQIGVGLWSGAGYTISTATSTSLAVTQKISGGLSGGFTGVPITITNLTQGTTVTVQPAAGFESTPLGATAAPPSPWGATIAEPIDAGTGTYIYNHTDVATGGGAFPYALSFGRTYTSSSNTTNVGLGNGWTHTYSINALRSSDPFVALGEGPAAAAAASIAALVVSQDLLSTTKNAQNMTLA